MLGTHNLGRVFYEPIKDRHGNMLIVTVREVESLYSFFNGKWMQISKLQSQRKSLSTPEEPTALDILLITIQVVLCFSYCVLFAFVKPVPEPWFLEASRRILGLSPVPNKITGKAPIERKDLYYFQWVWDHILNMQNIHEILKKLLQSPSRE